MPPPEQHQAAPSREEAFRGWLLAAAARCGHPRVARWLRRLAVEGEYAEVSAPTPAAAETDTNALKT